jgi:hypothetical protein
MAIAIEGTSGSGVDGDGAGIASITTNLTLGSGATKIIVPVGWSDGGSTQTITGITWNGSALSQVSSAAIAIDDTPYPFRGCDFWYLDSPTTGTHDLVTSFSATPQSVFHGLIGLSGAATGAPTFKAQTSGSANPASTATSSTAGSIVIGVASFYTTTDTDITPNNTQLLERTEQAQLDNTYNVSYDTATSPTMSWGNTSSDRYTLTTIEVAAAGGGGGGGVGRLIGGNLLGNLLIGGTLA